MNLDELVVQAQDEAVECLNIQRLDDIEGRYNFHGITKADANLLIQAVRGLFRKRRALEDALSKYGSHDLDHCGVNDGGACNCGLDKAKGQESAIRCDPGNISEFDADCLRHEIDRLRNELAESKELRADDHQTIVLQALHQTQAKAEIRRLETKLAESIGMWKRSLEVQHELEAEVVSLRTMAANLRLQSADE